MAKLRYGERESLPDKVLKLLSDIGAAMDAGDPDDMWVDLMKRLEALPEGVRQPMLLLAPKRYRRKSALGRE